MSKVKSNRAPVAFVVVQRDEGELLRAWMAHHTRLMPQCIIIVDDGSTDEYTRTVLQEVAVEHTVYVIYVEATHFDQERCVDLGIGAIRNRYPGVRWLFSLDVDEFLSIRTPLQGFTDSLEARGIVYASASHVNAVPELQRDGDVRRPWYLATTRYYRPWIERPWQEEGHLCKAFCRIHNNIRFAVGNHYVFHDRLALAFPAAPYTPVHLDPTIVCLRHFELRDCGEHLLQKLSNLSRRQVVPGADPLAPWWERNQRLDQLYRSYVGRPKDLYSELVTNGPRSLWGTVVPANRLLELEPL